MLPIWKTEDNLAHPNEITNNGLDTRQPNKWEKVCILGSNLWLQCARIAYCVHVFWRDSCRKTEDLLLNLSGRGALSGAEYLITVPGKT